MTREAMIKILLFIWRVVKVVTIFTVAYGVVVLKFLWKIIVAVVPVLFLFILAFFGGVAGGAVDAASRKSTSGRSYNRVWGDEENTSYYHRR